MSILITTKPGSGSAAASPTTQVLTSSGTYIPTNVSPGPSYIKIRAIGPGGGGSGSSTSTGSVNPGANGSAATTFSTFITAGAGGGGDQSGSGPNSLYGGVGGTASTSSPAIQLIAAVGNGGSPGPIYNGSASSFDSSGGNGGGSPFGGSGIGGPQQTAGNNATSYGAGGGGGGGDATPLGVTSGSGGGAGGYVEALLITPSTSGYAYVIGSGGAGGSAGSGAAGGSGANGVIIIEEYYTNGGGSGGGGSSYTFTDSLVNTAGTVTLVNDTASPGASMYYGTNASSVLGYYTLSGGSGANTALSNLAAVAINTSLLPGTSNSINLGSSSDYWATAYAGTFSALDGSSDQINYGPLSISQQNIGAALSISTINSAAASTGNINITTGNNTFSGGNNSGSIVIGTGTSNNGSSGNLTLSTGSASGGIPGFIYLNSSQGTGVYVGATGKNGIVAGDYVLSGSTSGAISQTASATTTSYTVTWPAAQGAASTVLTNNGTGVLSWATAGGGGTSTPTANTNAQWDANKNMSANAFIEGFTTTATAGTNTFLTVSSTEIQVFTGTVGQSVYLPVVTTLVAGQRFEITSLSTANTVTVYSSGGNNIQVLASNTTVVCTCVNTAGGTGTASWMWDYYPAQSGVLAIAYGGTGVSSVTTTPTASKFAGWDANINMSANNFIEGYATTVTSASSLQLYAYSAYQQFFTGSIAQTVLLPSSGMVNGFSFDIVNDSTATVTVKTFNSNTVLALPAGSSGVFTCLNSSAVGTASSWYVPSTTAAAGTLTGTTLASNVVSSSLTSVGTITTGVWNGTGTAGNAFLTAGTTYTTPAGISANTQFKFTLVGGGGAGGGVPATAIVGSAGGGGGGTAVVYLTGLSPSTAYTVAIGTGGSGASNANGGAGGATTLTALSTTYTAAGGGGGGVAIATGGALGGTGGTTTNATVGFIGQAGQDGGSNQAASTSGDGGASGLTFGAGARGIWRSTSGGGTTGRTGVSYGGGGSGGISGSTPSVAAGGNGAAGCILVEYWN